MVQSGNGESGLQSEDASSSFFHVKWILKEAASEQTGWNQRAKEGTLFRDEVRMNENIDSYK